MATNEFNRLTRNADGVLVTESGYWVQVRNARPFEIYVVCWDTVAGHVASRWFPTLLAARRFIERADGEPMALSAPEVRACHIARKAA